MGTLLDIGVSNAVMAALLALPAAAVGSVCRRPAVVHCLWLLVLLKLVTPPLFRVPISWPVRVRSARARTPLPLPRFHHDPKTGLIRNRRPRQTGRLVSLHSPDRCRLYRMAKDLNLPQRGMRCPLTSQRTPRNQAPHRHSPGGPRPLACSGWEDRWGSWPGRFCTLGDSSDCCAPRGTPRPNCRTLSRTWEGGWDWPAAPASGWCRAPSRPCSGPWAGPRGCSFPPDSWTAWTGSS
jgi:hypothetical protein